MQSKCISVACSSIHPLTFAINFFRCSFNHDSEEASTDFPTADIKIAEQLSDIAGHTDQMSQPSSRYLARRGSKSLPASPLSSPRLMRKAQNPYFTGTFSAVANNASSTGASSSVENGGRGWFLSSLLGVQREATSTTSMASHISEDAEETLTLPENITSNNTVAPKVIKARPSELREMNFWSPTSM